jgi:hypothetical protein
MTWRYSQSTGILYHNRTRIAKGYSGKGNSKNSGADEALKNQGPIPIGIPYNSNKVGPYSIPLAPLGHSAHGRSAFLIHDDNSTSTASEGCIIISPQSIRRKIIKSRDLKLDVVQ